MPWYFGECYIHLFKSLLRLDANLKVVGLSMKMSHLTVVLAGMMFYWLWEAQLISYFSFPLKTLPFKNLEEFLSKSDKKVTRPF